MSNTSPTPKAGMKDVQYAARHRDIIRRIATNVVNNLRPESKIGKVFAYDVNTRIAQILFPGETANSLVTARFAANNIPTRAISDDPLWTQSNPDDPANVDLLQSIPADIVRVNGRPGRYYIEDFISGVPMHTRYEPQPSLSISDAWYTDGANWTLTVAYIRKVGLFAHIRIVAQRLNTALGPDTDGNITNQVIATINDPSYWPVSIQAPLSAADTGTIVAGYISIAGEITLSAILPGITYNVGTSISLSGLYPIV